jgi:aflatoxin B1 aldehyde reductase
VRIYFLHAPDEHTPVEEQMEAIQTLYKQGMFEKFGVSNFTKEQVVEYYEYAKSKGYVRPTVYQCSYSPAVRRNETELFPTLRELGISIQSYSPMSGGLLAKTPEYIQEGKGNWDRNTVIGKLFHDLYNKPSYMKMLRDFGALSETSGISRTGLAYRWVRYHSVLDAELGDEMIIGSVTVGQLEQAMAELNSGPLPEWVVKQIEQLWEEIKEDSPANNLHSYRKIVGSL